MASLKTITIDIQANEVQTVFVNGSFIRFETLSGNVVVSTDNGDRIVMSQGKAVNIEPFTWVQIESTISQSVTIEIGFGSVQSNELSGNVSVKSGASFTGLNPKTFNGVDSQSVAADATRKEIHFMADPNNAGQIFIGATSASKGIPLQPGQTYIIQCSDSISLFGDTNGDVLWIAEVKE